MNKTERVFQGCCLFYIILSIIMGLGGFFFCLLIASCMVEGGGFSCLNF